MRKKRPHIVNHNRFKAEFIYAEVYAFKVTSLCIARVLYFSAFIAVRTVHVEVLLFSEIVHFFIIKQTNKQTFKQCLLRKKVIHCQNIFLFNNKEMITSENKKKLLTVIVLRATCYS